MKTSNKLFVVLFTFVLLLVIGANLVLKAEYDKINFSDPFHGYALSPTPAFKAVRVLGNLPGSVRLQRGSAFEVRVSQNRAEHLQWQLQGDTLVIEYIQPETENRLNVNQLPREIYLDQALQFPLVYVMAPTLQTVQSESTTVLRDWQEAEMMVAVTGRHLILDQNNIGQLSLTASQGCFTEIKNSNQIETASVVLQDSSSLQVKKDVFTAVRLQASPHASVNVPVSVLQKIMLEQRQF